MFFITHWFNMAVAGAGSFIWHWGIGGGLIILLLLAAFFTTSIPLIGPYLTNARRDLLWAAFCIALVLGGMYVGAADEKKRCEARSIVIEHVVEKAVIRAQAPLKKRTFQKGVKRTSDPWDNSEN